MLYKEFIKNALNGINKKETMSEAEIQMRDTLKSYKKMGIEYYEFFADADKKTCKKCKSLDGKKFKVSKAKIGVNAPPLHDGCRCCILPVVD